MTCFLEPLSFGVAWNMIIGNCNIPFHVFLRVLFGQFDGLAKYSNFIRNKIKKTANFTNHPLENLTKG